MFTCFCLTKKGSLQGCKEEEVSSLLKSLKQFPGRHHTHKTLDVCLVSSETVVEQNSIR